VAIVFTGAGFGYWMVRRFILSKDGSVDAGIAQFVKWAMRVVATLFMMQVWFYLVFPYHVKYSSQEPV
jgi:cationic amino acid transporter 1